MKKCRFLLSVFMALTLCVICFAAGADYEISAAGSVKITITPAAGDTASHTYEAYQVFSGTASVNEQNETVFSALDWGTGIDSTGLLAALKADTLLKTDFASCSTPVETAAVISSYDDNSAKLNALANVISSNLSSVKYTSAEVTGNTSAVITSTDGPGYYFIKDSNAASPPVFILCSAETAISVPAKFEVPTLEKKIVSGSSEVTANTAAVGDTVSYRLKTSVPENVKTHYSSYKLVITDTLSEGLTFDEESVVLYKDSIADDNKITAGYTVSNTASGSDTVIKITMNDVYDILNTGSATDIIAEYTAVLNENAVIDSTGNPNTACLEYSNNPSADTLGKTPDQTVRTYTTEITINKTDGLSGQPLQGAEFEIIKDGVTILKDFVDSSGSLKVSGLDAGTYTIKETTIPSGYNPIDDMELVIAASVSTNPDGCDWTYNISGADISGSVITVENRMGIVLPATGGMGTVIFYIAGGTIMLAAGILFVTKIIVDHKEKKNK